MNSKSYMRNRFPIMKRNHEKIKVRLKPDTPMQSQIIEVSQKYDIPKSIDQEISIEDSTPDQKVIKCSPTYFIQIGFGSQSAFGISVKFHRFQKYQIRKFKINLE